METIYDLQKKAKLISEKTYENSISPSEIGELHFNTLAYLANMEQSYESLGIRKVYASKEEMEGDNNPKTIHGKSIKFGQLVVIKTTIHRQLNDGDIYAYQIKDWRLVGNLYNFIAGDYIKNFLLTIDISSIKTIFVTPEGEITDLYKQVASATIPCVFNVLDNGKNAGQLVVFSDSMKHCLILEFTTICELDENDEFNGNHTHKYSNARKWTCHYTTERPGWPLYPYHKWSKWVCITDALIRQIASVNGKTLTYQLNTTAKTINLGEVETAKDAEDFAALSEIAGNENVHTILFYATYSGLGQSGVIINTLDRKIGIAQQTYILGTHTYIRHVTGADGSVGTATNAFDWEPTSPHKLLLDSESQVLTVTDYSNNEIASVHFNYVKPEEVSPFIIQVNTLEKTFDKLIWPAIMSFDEQTTQEEFIKFFGQNRFEEMFKIASDGKRKIIAYADDGYSTGSQYIAPKVTEQICLNVVHTMEVERGGSIISPPYKEFTLQWEKTGKVVNLTIKLQEGVYSAKRRDFDNDKIFVTF